MLVAQGQPAASAHLSAAPFQTSLSLKDDEFRASLQCHLNLTTSEAESIVGQVCVCNAKCGNNLEAERHLDHCKFGGAPIKRHDAIKDEIVGFLKAAGYKVTSEPRGVLVGEGQGGPDILVEDFPKKGQTTVMDMMIPSVYSDTSVTNGADHRPGTAARAGLALKLAKHDVAAKKSGCVNWPLVMELQGGPHPGVTKVLKIVAEQAKRTNRMHRIYGPIGVSEGEDLQLTVPDVPWTSRSPVTYMQQRLAVALVRARHAGRWKTLSKVKRVRH